MKKTRKLIAVMLVMTLVLTMFCACGSKKGGDSVDNYDGKAVASGKVIKVGVLNAAAGSIPHYRADIEGYYADQGLKVETYEFANGVLINEAFAAGELDVAINGFAAAYSLGTGEYTYVGDACEVQGHGIWVRDDSPLLTVQGEFDSAYPDVYGSKETAEGLKIFCQLGSITQILVDAYMAKLGNTDYELVGMEVGSSLNAFIIGEADGVVLHPPYLGTAEEAGLVEIATYEEVCGGFSNEILMCSNEMLEDRYGDLILFTQSFYKAAAELEADDDLFYDDGMAFFASCGTEYSDQDMRDLMDMRMFFTADNIPDQLYGHHVSFTISNLISLGMMEDGTNEVYAEHTGEKVLKDALGINVTPSLAD